jgi:hypothetical protein
MTTCINLLDRLGTRYRVSFDPSRAADHPRTADPWEMQIQCERGVIFPFGGDLLAVEVDGRAVTISRLRSLSCCRVHQEGERDATFLFGIPDFGTVAAVVRPRRRRQVSDAERERLFSIGFKGRAQPDHSQRAPRHAGVSG